MATQHGYYPFIGDFIQPDRPTWRAMQGDKNGMDLARKIKTGVGVATGYIEFNGLKGLKPDIAARIKNDIQTLF